MEIWKDISGYDYEISNTGVVRSKNRTVQHKTGPRNLKQKTLKPSLVHGYYAVRVCKNGNPKLKYIHRLVAEAFLENPNNYPMIDHIDRDRLNNTPTNLRWANSCMNNQNRTHNNNTGERHIFYHPRGYYVVAITKNYITTQKYASTLNDAIAYRDLLLLNID